MSRTTKLYPLRFEPVFQPYMWGGRRLEAWGRKLPDGIVAESWEISDHPKNPTRVSAGKWLGRTLGDVIRELGTDVLGWRYAWALALGRFPLLVKLLDAQQDLSVQVHPDDEQARRRGDDALGKTEMWYILETQPGARIVYGLDRPTDREGFRRALEGGGLETLLAYQPVAAGDAVFVPPGMLHALLAGIVAVEIQQTSDVTYRVYDWDRLGADGRPRPLHVESALEVIDFSLVRPGLSRPAPVESRPGLRREILATCAAFRVERITLETGATLAGDSDGSSFEIWGCLEGECALEWAGGQEILGRAQFTLLPAALGAFSITPCRPATLLRALAPADDGISAAKQV